MTLLTELPPLPRRERPDRPCCVYRCYDENDQIVYIGSSVNPRARWHSHKSGKRAQVWRPRVRLFTEQWFSTVYDAETEEGICIYRQKPPGNYAGVIKWDVHRNALRPNDGRWVPLDVDLPVVGTTPAWWPAALSRLLAEIEDR